MSGPRDDGDDREDDTRPSLTVGPLPIRVLVVEDDPDTLDALSVALTDRYEVTSADNGALAISYLAVQHFDAVVLDLFMPGADGEAVLAALRAGTNRAQVVLASGSTQIESTARRFQVAGYVKKPFSLEALEAAVSAAVERPSRRT